MFLKIFSVEIFSSSAEYLHQLQITPAFKTNSHSSGLSGLRFTDVSFTMEDDIPGSN